MNLIQLMTNDSSTDNLLFHCSVCDICPSSKAEWISHASGRAHAPKKEEPITRNVINDIRSKVINQSKHLLADQNKFVKVGVEEDRCTFSCLLCDVNVMSYFALSDHLEDELHGMKVRAYQSLKEEKSGVAKVNNDETPSIHSENTDPQSEPEMHYSAQELLSKFENTNSILEELNQFFIGSLKCLNCQQSITLDSEIVKDHLKKCFLKEVVDETHSEDYNIEKEFISFMRMTENNNGLDNSRIVLNESASQCDETQYHIPAAAFQDLQSESGRLSIMAPHSFRCLECNITDSMNEWKDHFLKHHAILSNGSYGINDNMDSIICTCTLCQVMLFGQREEIINHEPCISKGKDLFFLFSSYPQLKTLLDSDHVLPRYYRFSRKYASSSSMQMAFFCLSCDFYGFDKLKKHFQSKDHKSKIHSMFEFLYCTSCSILFYADRLLFEDHCHTPSHICSNFPGKSKENCASKFLVSRGHEDLLASLRRDILEYWKERPLNNTHSLVSWCEPCLYYTNDLEEWRNVHLTSETHMERMKHKEYFEHVCVVCKMNSVGCAEFHAAHCSSEIHKNIKNKAVYDFNERRMMEKRSSERFKHTSMFENQEVDSISKTKDENSDRRKSNVKGPKNYNLEHEPYSLKMSVLENVNKELIQEFLKKIIQKHGAIGRIRSYFCAFCNYYSSEKSWWSHLKTAEHVKAILNYSDDPKNVDGHQSIIFCSQCKFFGLGSHTIRSIHSKSIKHKKMTTKAKLEESITRDSSPLFSSSSTDGDDEENFANGNGISLGVVDIHSTTDLKNTDTMMNQSDDEKNEVESEDELYEMVMREESDTERRATSDDELDKSVLKQVKNNVNSNTRVQDEASKDDNEGDNRENSVEYSLVVSGIPAPVMKKRALLKEAFTKYVQFDRTFVRKSKPNSIYLVVSKDLDGSYRRLKENLIHLKAKWGTDELTIAMNTEEKFDLSGMRDHLLEPAVVLFSDKKELASAVIHMINRYDAEANSSLTKRKIFELEMVITQLAAHIYRNYRVVVKTHVFGSRVTGLAAENSDVDIYMQIGTSFRGLISNNVDLQQQLVVLFSKEMRSHPRDFCDITSIPFARVPIVKFKHIKSNLNCDLSFKSGLSTMNSMLVKTYLELDERIKYVVCAVKLWMKLNELADRNLFTTYAQIWMVLFFLMQADIAVIPTVIKLKNMLPVDQQILTVEGWNCSFPGIRNIVWRSSCTLTGEELLCKFFEFYSNQSLINYVLCTLTGLKLEKKYFMKYYDSLPEIFRPFKHRIEEDRVLFRKISNDFESFCVQDPFDHCHNLTKTINVRKFEAFIGLCKQTVELLKS